MAKQDKAAARDRQTHSDVASGHNVAALDDVSAVSPVPQAHLSNSHSAVHDLRESEELFAAVFSSTTIGVAVLTLTAGFLQVNDAFCQIVGYSREDLATLNCFSLTHPDDCPAMEAKIAALVAGEIPTFLIEKRYIRKDGARIWVRNSVSLTRDIQGKPLHLVALCQDITGRRQAEETLRAHEDELARELADMKQLQDISGQLIHEGKRDDLYAKVLDAAIVVMESDMGSMQVFYPERNELRLIAWKGFAAESAAFWQWVRVDSGSTCGVALRTGARVIVSDVETCDFMAGTDDLDFYRHSGIQAVQSTPLVSRDGRLLGMISTHWRLPHQPSERDLRMLDVLARQAADLIEHRQTEEALRAGEEHQSFLLMLEDRLRDLTDPPQVKQVACEMLGVHLGVWRVAYGEVDPRNGGALILENGWTNGALPALSGRFPFRAFGTEIVADLAAGKDVTIEDFETDPRLAEPKTQALLRPLGIGLGDSAMIVRNGYLAGLLFVHSKTARRWTSEEHRLLREVAERTWEAVVRAKAEEALRASEERYRTLFSLVPVAVYSCDADGAIREFNQSAVELWGREPNRGDQSERYCGSLRLFSIDGRPMPLDECPMARVLRGETLADGDEEILVERPDGSRRHVIAHPQALTNERGDILGAINCLYDFTERKRLEEESAYLAAIVTSSYDAIVSKTLDGIVTSWNASAEQMFGFTAEEMIGQSILRIIPPERSEEENFILASIRSGERIEHFETVRMTKDGRLLDVSLTISPMRNSTGEIIGASKIARDITERKRMEEALRVSERRMNEFLGIAAHELRTPLTSITANVQMALRQVSGLRQPTSDSASASASDSDSDGAHIPAQPLRRAEVLLERTDRQISRLARLVNDLVDVSRIQADKLEMRWEPCDLLPLVREAVREQRAAWPHRTISLAIQPPLKSAIIADADRIGQVITNYLTNALKYSPDETAVAVTVSAQAEDGSVRVEVRDQGPGLSMEQQAHLFERFYRVPGVEQQSGSGVGLGLGLHICKTIIERHGGSVGVVSAPGEGSVFWFTLPLAMEQHA